MISRKIILAKDEIDMEQGRHVLESEILNTAHGTKSFLKRVEDEIGLKKIRYGSKAAALLDGER